MPLRDESKAEQVAELPDLSTAPSSDAERHVDSSACDAKSIRTSADPDEAPEKYRDPGSDVDDPYVATANYMASAVIVRRPESSETDDEEGEANQPRRRPRPK